MIRTNLSTRPFYNERAAHVAIAIAAAVVLAITVFNGVRVVTLSRHNTELSSRISQEQAEVRRLNQEAAAIRRTINKDELKSIVAAAQEANSLIDQRTFSWTAFFNRIETTIPPEVMLTSVRPAVRDGETHISLQVLARDVSGIDEFMEKLNGAGAFTQVIPSQQDVTDSDKNKELLYRATIESVYTEPQPAPKAPPAKPPPAGRGPAPGGTPRGGRP